MKYTNALLSTTIQPSIISLFSSSGSDPLALFTVTTDKTLPADSFVHFLHDHLSSPPPASPMGLLRRELEQTVLHIQSPTLPTTYIHCPPITASAGSVERSAVLGIKHPWMHIQVRNLSREWSFEVGIVDQAGRVGILRFSTFQKKPSLKTSPGALPLLLLPLSFPAQTAHLLTAWSTITVHFPSILPYFTSPHFRDADGPAHPNYRASQPEGPGAHAPQPPGPSLPAGTYAHVSYVRVHANCRLRRIWFGEGDPGQKVPWEFELYALH
ncbi:hypothetical protein HYPSUDRAFT_190988 [Hypholoma sublateritium FD-334 SS-4]|uniref:CFA20 domain-containing protein n=1 Tax=Hypholoma sublateritium (strain FD-334 SS-4) TaxID=945553 RepID=A0A0D2PDV8_HYPSF|nr:hypothetical protein HYPSUDRAFT_190988 [Hypholoma sublateritium FD-334 SS-4]